MDIKETLKKIYRKFQNSDVMSMKVGLKYEFAYNEGKKYVKIVGINPGIKTANVPNEIQGVPVEVIGKGAFKGNASLKKVVLKNKIRVVGAEAFMNCKNLEKVELPADLETINASCFENCTSLESVILPYEVKTISKRAFKNCTKLSDMPHYMKTGISATVTLDKKLVEKKLPSGLEYIGESAFENCESIEQAYIPYQIEKIKANVFKGCKKLREVYFHNKLKEIEDHVFSGCDALTSVKLPLSIEHIGEKAFDSACNVKCYEGVSEEVLKQLSVCNVSIIYDEALNVDSMMIPKKTDGAFYTQEDLDKALELYELRTPSSEIRVHEDKPKEIKESRYELKDGTYFYNDSERKDVAKILMTGDLMCRPIQIKTAFKDGEYNFDQELELVQDILRDSDLTIGNMESMVAHSMIYSDESNYIDDRVHLNAPDSFLNSVRKAGFDVVINSQNHAYDTGLKGVYETLNALNQQQLMHTGVFAGNKDKRYISLCVNGIRIAIVSYFDQARQAMKRVNFTEKGLEALYSNFYEEQIKSDIENARKDGAEFVIAYCHWGREYTDEISNKQKKYSEMVANAGADYIFGSHSHCLQPYDVINTKDGREVPVLYSGGNFLSDMSIKMPIVRDTLVAQLELYRDENGKVQIQEEGYYPCLIRADEKKVRGKMYTVPIQTLLNNCDNEEKVQLEEAVFRIHAVVGRTRRFKLLIPDEINPLKTGIKDDGSRYWKYTCKKPLMIEVNNEAKDPENKFVKDRGTSIYESKRNLETKEAVLMCSGQICYDAKLGNRAKFGEFYNFRENFQLVRKCFDKADLAIGNFTAMACETYLSSEMMKNKYSVNKYYSNARLEYLDAIKYAGFDCLAAANPNNLDTGVDGIWRTIQNIEKYGMTSVGIGEEKNKIFNVNDIKVGVLSYTLNCKDHLTMITAEGADVLLNIYSKKRAQKDIEELKQRGAEFVLTYVTCGSSEKKVDLAARKAVAEEVAELGADYVICTVPKVISKYYRYQTKDERTVPIATSLGTFMSGSLSEDENFSSLLRIVLYKTVDGAMEIVDDYIPLKQFESFEGYNYTTVPAVSAFYPKYKEEDFQSVRETLQEKMGNAIKAAEDKVVTIGEFTQPQLTFGEIYKILGAVPSEKVKEQLPMDQKATCIATRRAELKEGCVAVIVQHKGYKRPEFQIEIEDAINAKAALIVAEKQVTNIPTIVKSSGQFRKAAELLFEAVLEKYHPITVAITGTAGKTTTKEFASCVFETHYKTLHVVGNYNQFYTCGAVLQKLDDSYEAYIQEVHGGTKNSAKNISNLIKPDIAIITNIGDGHLLDMGTIENVIEGKLDIASGIKKTGVLIVNNDNEYMKDLTMRGKRVIHYSTFDKNCEYYAQNIQNFGDKVKFQVVCEKGVFDLVLNMQGLHNIGNAIAVFAAGIEANIPPHKIIAGLTHYVPDADKQNLLFFSGYQMLIDTYSATPISVESAMQTLSEYPVADGARRIAVLGDIPALGDSSDEKHKEVGEKICKYNFDVMLCVGSDSKHFAEEAKKVGKEAYFYENREAFNRKLAECIQPGDFILFKSGTRSHLKEETIYPLFGLIDKQ